MKLKAKCDISHKDALQCITDVSYLLNRILKEVPNDSHKAFYLRQMMCGDKIEPKHLRNMIVEGLKKEKKQ